MAVSPPVARSTAPIRVGCSGWNYRHWRGSFYPPDIPARRWFDHYATQFETVEINNSFYRLPKAETFDAWRTQAPPGFRYAVKANRFITQAKKLRDCGEPVARMIAPTRHLGETLGPILYQLPPMLGLDLPRLEAFLGLLPRDLTHVFEFRHSSWHIAETAALLAEYGASPVTHDFPAVASPRWAAGPVAYVRFHGGTGKYVGRYPRGTLEGWAEWMMAQSAAGRPVWAYFNNDIDAAAIADALSLKTLLAQQ